MNNYTASDIRILSDTEAIDRMPWLQAQSLADKYQKPVSSIARDLEAYYRAGYTAEAYIKRDPAQASVTHKAPPFAFR